MFGKNFELLKDVAGYYSEKLEKYGDTPRGVDWNGAASQNIRFEQLCKTINSVQSEFSLNDLGCGYGAFLEFLRAKHPACTYFGIDISQEMIGAAEKRHSAVANTHFIVSAEPVQIADYGVASGIFNVRLKRTDAEWFNYLLSTLDILNCTSRMGFAFNCLTSYSDECKKRDYLYYADPCRLFDLCKRRYSSQVALLHDYGLYEFTIIVRKN